MRLRHFLTMISVAALAASTVVVGAATASAATTNVVVRPGDAARLGGGVPHELGAPGVRDRACRPRRWARVRSGSTPARRGPRLPAPRWS